MKKSTEQIDNYTVLKINIGNENLPDWLTNNKQIIVPEMVTTAEKIIYDDIKETIPVLILVGEKITQFIKSDKKNKNVNPSIIVGLELNDIDDMLEKSLDWAIKEEEYELCHRIKLLQERNAK
jgi:hypothetical protein